MKQWFVGMTKDQQELRAAAELRDQDYVVYLPKIYYRHQEGKKIEARSALRFTGYIFIRFDLALEQNGPISSTRGMDGSDGSALICDGAGKPRAMQPGILETLREIEDEEFARAIARKKPEPRKDLLRGELVKFVGDPDHPAYGLEGTYLGPMARGIGKVLVAFAQWDLPECDLRKVQLQEKQAA